MRSSSNGLSSMSDTSCQSIYNVLISNFTSVGISIVNNIEDLLNVIHKRPDLVFLGMKYIPRSNENSVIWISEFLSSHGITHTGSDQRAIEYELHKPLAKERVKTSGIATSKSIVIPHDLKYNYANIQLQFPLFVKPASLGGGAGINGASKVHTINELHSQLAYINQNFESDILVEEYLPGREFSVALLHNLLTGGLDAMPIELSAPIDDNGKPELSQEIKTANLEVVLPVIDPVVRSLVTTLAKDAFNSLGGRDYGRIDIRMDDFGVPNFLEANLIPSLISGYGSFPKACVLNQNLEYTAMILRIVHIALRRIEEPYTAFLHFDSAAQDPVPA